MLIRPFRMYVEPLAVRTSRAPTRSTIADECHVFPAVEPARSSARRPSTPICHGSVPLPPRPTRFRYHPVSSSGGFGPPAPVLRRGGSGTGAGAAAGAGAGAGAGAAAAGGGRICGGGGGMMGRCGKFCIVTLGIGDAAARAANAALSFSGSDTGAAGDGVEAAAAAGDGRRPGIVGFGIGERNFEKSLPRLKIAPPASGSGTAKFDIVSQVREREGHARELSALYFAAAVSASGRRPRVTGARGAARSEVCHKKVCAPPAAAAAAAAAVVAAATPPPRLAEAQMPNVTSISH